MTARQVMQWLACLTALASPCSVVSQSSLGRIVGTIVDQQGLPMARVKVEATNLSSQAVTSTVSDLEGTYSFGFLAGGEYSVSASAPGFAISRKYLRLHFGQAVLLNFSLTIAPATAAQEDGGTGVRCSLRHVTGPRPSGRLRSRKV